MKRRFLAPEVIQIGAMDCGPAVLKCMASGWNVTFDLERVRDACQTSIDGTSIDSLEDALNAVGIPARQFVFPQSAIGHIAATHAPFILIVRNATGAPHFVVVWNVARGRIQIMDPAAGRVWVKPEELLQRLYVESVPITARQIRGQKILVEYLESRMQMLGLPHWKERLQAAVNAADLDQIAALQAILHELDHWVNAGLMPAGKQTAAAGESALANWDVFRPDWAAGDQRWRQSLTRDGTMTSELIRGWNNPFSLPMPTIRMAPSKRILIFGAVMLGVPRGSKKSSVVDSKISSAARGAVVARDASVLRHAFSVLKKDRSPLIAVLTLHLPWVLLVTVGEVFLLRAALSAATLFATGLQRLFAAAAYVSFLGIAFLLELFIAHGVVQLGRRAEVGTHASVLARLARLRDTFFRSRLLSDLAHRTYSAKFLHSLPAVVAGIVKGVLDLLVVVIAVFFLNVPTGVTLAVSVIVLGFALYFVGVYFASTQRKKIEHTGALSQFYLDALLAHVPVHTHGAAPSMRVGFEEKLAHWYRAGKELVERNANATAVAQTLFVLATIATLGVAVTSSLARESILLLLLWTQRIPATLLNLTTQLRTLPRFGHDAARLLEPLRANETSEIPSAVPDFHGGPVSIEFRDVAVDVVGNRILEGVNLRIGAGEHIAIVGASGSGKSTLIQTLLGFQEVAAGAVLVNGRPHDDATIAALRRVTAWVDPGVQLFRHSLLENVLYGNERRRTRSLDEAAELSDLKSVLESMPGGYQRNLGEGGRLLSGGEGQRVRLARAMISGDTRLALLDEAFRGLERSKRRDLLQRARITWAAATLLCITHDVTLTPSFPRVIVIADGKIVEDGVPADLMSRDTRYARMLAREEGAVGALWTSTKWQTLKVERGSVARED